MNFTTIKQKIKEILIWSQKYTKTDMIYLAKNSFWTSIGKFFATISGILVLIFLTKYVSKDIVGQYNFFLAILAIISIFSIPGLNTSTIEAVAKNNDGVYKKAVKTSFIWSWLGSLVLIFIAFYFYFLKNDSNLFYIFLVTSFLFPFQYAPNTWRSFLIAKQKFKQLNFYASIQSILYLLAMIFVIIFSHGNLFYIILIYLLIQIIPTVIFYFLTQKTVKNNNENSDWKEYGFFLTKMQIINTVMSNIDTIIIGFLFNMQSLAIYSIGQKISSSLIGVFKQFFFIYSPKLSKKNDINFKKYFYIFLLSVFFSIMAIIFVPFIIKIIFPTYEASILITQIFLFFIPLSFFDLILSFETTYNLKNKKIIFYRNIITPLVYFLLIMSFVFLSRNIIVLTIIVGLKNIINIIIFWKCYSKKLFFK
jgi:PST family polysaccharide transporter